jgi:hypothetical protein
MNRTVNTGDTPKITKEVVKAYKVTYLKLKAENDFKKEATTEQDKKRLAEAKKVYENALVRLDPNKRQEVEDYKLPEHQIPKGNGLKVTKVSRFYRPNVPLKIDTHGLFLENLSITRCPDDTLEITNVELNKCDQNYVNGDTIMVEWVDTLGKNGKPQQSYRGVYGIYNEAEKKITGIQEVSVTASIMAEIEIKKPKAKYAAANIAIIAGNGLPGHPKGDLVIQKADTEEGTYIDLKAIFDWVSSVSDNGGNVQMPEIPVGGSFHPDVPFQAAEFSIIYKPDTNKLTAFEEAIDIIVDPTDATKTIMAKQNAIGIAATDIKNDLEAKFTQDLKDKLTVSLKTHLYKKLSLNILKDSTSEQDFFDKLKQTTSKPKNEKQEIIEAINNELKQIVPYLKKEISSKAIINGQNIETAVLIIGDQLIDDLVINIFTGAITKEDLKNATNAKPADRFKLKFNDLSYNISKSLFTLDLESEKGNELTIGAFTLKKVGLFISNDPKAIENKYPSKKMDKKELPEKVSKQTK